jgi:biofilm PGA synthesis N-glycosyltransferase PgaC
MSFSLDSAGNWIFIFFCIFFLIQVMYYLFVFSRLAFYKKPSKNPVRFPVSVIICAKNELKNLHEFLPLVLEQDYPDFQVVVVNDCSWDESEKYLEEMEAKHANLKVVTIKEQEKYQHGKKFALALGIKAAKNEYLLLTDADCRPSGNQWIGEMVRNFDDEKEIVIGYGGYIKEPGFLNKWIRMDTVFNAMQFLSYALNHNAYMGVGRNLAYKKSLFFKNKGFASHYHIMSGDDDLFINEVATPSNHTIEISPTAFTCSRAKSKFGDWLRQKKRHMSSSALYKTKHKLLLGMFYLTQEFFYISCILLLFLKLFPDVVVSAFIFRLILLWFITGRNMKKLGEIDLWWFVPVYDLMVLVLYPALSVSNMIFKNKTWK